MATYARCFSFGTAHHSGPTLISTNHMWNSEVICDACESHQVFACNVRPASPLHDCIEVPLCPLSGSKTCRFLSSAGQDPVSGFGLLLCRLCCPTKTSPSEFSLSTSATGLLWSKPRTHVINIHITSEPISSVPSACKGCRSILSAARLTHWAPSL